MRGVDPQPGLGGGWVPWGASRGGPSAGEGELGLREVVLGGLQSQVHSPR